MEAMEETAFFQLIQKKELAGAYLLYGAEPYSRESAVKQILELVEDAARELNTQLLKNPPTEDVINACETLPFFAEKRVVRVRELAADAATSLAPYMEKVPEWTILLVEYAGKPNVQNALFKTMQKQGRTVEFAAFEPERAVAFIEKRARARKVEMEHNAARRMVDWLGTDLSTLENTLYLLAGYVGDGGCITPQTVAHCVTPSSEYKIFTILDALIAGNKKDAVGQLMGMIKSGADTSMRLASFFEGRIRQMVQAKAMLLHGIPEQQIVKALGGSPYAAKKTVQNARKCKAEQLLSALDGFAAVDWQQKQGRMKDDDALLLAVLQNF